MYSAPPLVGGYGYGGMGYSSFMPPVILGPSIGYGMGGIGFMGGIFQLFIVATVLQFVLSAVSKMGSKQDGGNGSNDEDTM